MMKRKQSSLLAASVLLLGQFVGGASASRAGDFDLRSTAQSDTDSKASSGDGGGFFGRKKINFTFDSRVGYDDNTLAQPDVTIPVATAAGTTVRRHVNGQSSVFFNFDLGASYLAATSRSTLSIGADVGVSYYLDRPGRNYDVNGALTLGFTYKVAPRLFLEASAYNAYISEGDYGASNLTNFGGNAINGAHTPGTTDNRNGDYFYTTETLSLTYQAAPRVSLVTGYAITAFAYDNEPYKTIDDRVEQYFSEELRYLLLPNLTLAGDYRFGYVDYFGVSNDSYTNFVLGGVDYIFNPRLRGSVRAGAEFRVYVDSIGNQTSPYAEASLGYDVSRRTNLQLFARYGIEEGGLTAAVSNSDAVRLGFTLNQQFTARISGYLSYYYVHSYYQNPTGNITNFNEDSYDVAVGARYAINRHFSLEAGYTHTTVDSQQAFRSYDRNRVFGGVRFAF